MKRLLLALVVAGLFPLQAAPSLADQTKALQKVLWEDQVLAGLKNAYIDVNVLPAAKMLDTDGKQCQCWGLVFANKLGYHVQVLDAQEFPKNFPAKLIAQHQREVVAHEVLHIVFGANKMPDDVQDQFIEAVLPMLRVK